MKSMSDERLEKLITEWQATRLEPYVKEHPERPEGRVTASGTELAAAYFPSADAADSLGKQGFPGEYPYTRGISPNMYRSDLWVMGMYSGSGSAEGANQRYRYLLAQGQTGFSIALDLPTQMGYDSDHPLAKGEVGKVGVPLNSLEDMERLFDSIPLAEIKQIRTTANAIGPVMAALYIAYAEKMGQAPESIRMFLQNDVLKEYCARSTYIVPPRAGVKLSTDVIEYAARYLPSWVPIAISGYHMRDAGGTAAQEVAFTLANGMAYIDEALKRGIGVDQFAPQLFAFFSSTVDLLEEIAKFRAARRIWARIMKETYGAQRPESLQLRIFAYTLGGVLTAQQPLNNIVRVTMETLAAVLGGVQTLATSAYDEALGIPTELSATVALRTQQVVAYEAGVTGTADPLGGSYAVEALTDKLEAQVMAYLDQIATRGGAISCIEEGYFQRELADAAYRQYREIESGQRVVVGVNRFQMEEESTITPSTPDTQAEELTRARLQALRSRRDSEAVNAALGRLEATLRAEENSIPPMVAAVKAYTTMGEIADVLRKVYGVYRDPAIF